MIVLLPGIFDMYTMKERKKKKFNQFVNAFELIDRDEKKRLRFFFCYSQINAFLIGYSTFTHKIQTIHWMLLLLLLCSLLKCTPKIILATKIHRQI